VSGRRETRRAARGVQDEERRGDEDAVLESSVRARLTRRECRRGRPGDGLETDFASELGHHEAAEIPFPETSPTATPT